MQPVASDIVATQDTVGNPQRVFCVYACARQALSKFGAPMSHMFH